MFDDILQTFLDDAIDTYCLFSWYRGGNLLSLEFNFNSLPLFKALAFRIKSLNEAQVLKNGGMELTGQTMNIFRNLNKLILYSANPGF